MNIEKTPMHQLLLAKGYDSGWALAEEKLLAWEHDADPPAPLTRPEAQDDLAG
jgi:hypothetical protein